MILKNQFCYFNTRQLFSQMTYWMLKMYLLGYLTMEDFSKNLINNIFSSNFNFEKTASQKHNGTKRVAGKTNLKGKYTII